MKYLTTGRLSYPESIGDCNDLDCGDCVMSSFNLKSLLDCSHRNLLVR